MKKLLCVLLLGFMPWSAHAEAVLSCDDIEQLGESLTALGIAMDDENAEIGEGSSEDAALRDVVLALAEIAKAEDDADLANASIAMAEGWDNMDRDAFTDGLAEAVVKLAAISVNECGG
ncbi:MAG: hypothetical protein IPK97_20685 [Ahniella sp.]|nr:hypothetical protein [Ahniella sp.]